MSRRSKKKLNNRAKVLIIIAILAISLFIIHKFNFLTKSEEKNVTNIKFIDSETKEVSTFDVEVLQDEENKSYIVLPEKINGYYASNYYITSNSLTNETENNLTENIVNTENVLVDDKGKIEDTNNIAQGNTTISENTISNTTISNTTNTTTNSNTSNKIETRSIDNNSTITTISDTNNSAKNIINTNTAATSTKDTQNSAIENILEESIDNKEENNINEVENETTSNENEKNENYSTIQNNNNEQEKSNEANEVPNSDNTEIIENENTENTSSNENTEINSENNSIQENAITEYKPGEIFYLSEEIIESNSLSIEVKYQTKEINGLTLYNQELIAYENTEDESYEINLKGYIPKGYYIEAEKILTEEVEQKLSDVEEFEDAEILVSFDIKITDGANEYQPKDYYQAVTVTITSDTYLEGNLSGGSAEVLHLDETETEELIERITVTEKTENSTEFITDAFSIYVIVTYPAVTDEYVAIDDYDDDYNYYMGLNYTSTISGENQNIYTDSNLAKVTINYYSYDYEKNWNGNNDLPITNYTWAYQNYQDTGTYVNYTIRLTINAPSGTSINPNKSWYMKFDLPNEYFSTEETLNANGTKLNTVSVNDSIVTITGNDLSSWTVNTAEKKYTVDIVLSFERETQVTGTNPITGAEIRELVVYDLNSVSNFSVTANEKVLVGYVSNQEDNPSTTKNESERQVLFSYIKCMPIDSGYVSFEVIDNPYMDRPAGYGFDGWVSHDNTLTFSFNNNTKIQSIKAKVGENNQVTIDVYANWIEANIVFLNTKTGATNNDGKTLNTPTNTAQRAATILRNNFKTATKASDRELNIIVYTGGTIDSLSNLNTGSAFTLTSLYDGVDYRSNAVYRITESITFRSDAQFDFVNMHNWASSGWWGDGTRSNTGYTYSASNSSADASNLSYYFIGDTYNIRIGRGMNPLAYDSSQSDDATVRQVQGGSTDTSANRSEYRLIIESGKYVSVHTGKTTGYSGDYTSSGTTILGCDFDRVKEDNENLKIYHRACARTSSGRARPYNGKPSYEMIVKSGRIGMESFASSSQELYSYAGIYVGTFGNGSSSNEYGNRILIVEGGNIANIIGGLGTTNGTSAKTYIYVKDGSVQNIVGGAGVTETYGDRYIQVTGGEVAYSVSGGSNGWLASTTNNGGNNGRLTGNTLIYIGANSTIGTQSTSSTLYYVNAGCVLGAGNGTTNTRYQSTSGQVTSSHVIIDGNATISNNVYGGGNYGVSGRNGAGSPSTEINDATTVAKIDIYGGTVNGSVFGGSNQNGINGSIAITMEDGTVNGAIYGGSNATGTVDGAAHITIQGGTIGTAPTTSTDAISDVVFGGGQGSPTIVSQRTVINITDEKNNLTLNGHVYGGSALGTVSGSSIVNVKDSSTVSNTITSIGNFFGGGKGNNSTSAITRRNVTLTIDGGTYSSSKAFGGCNINGTIGGNVNVYVGENSKTTIDEVYGGGNEAEITTSTPSVYVYLYKNANVSNAFNGGNSAGISGSTNQTGRAIYAQGATVGNLYGGSNVTGDLKRTFVYVSDGATIGNVYGGGCGEDAIITERTYVDIKDSSITECAYGGGDAGSVDTYTELYISNSTVNQSVYAAGKGDTATVATNASAEITDSTILENVYGGGNAGSVGGNTDIILNNTNVGKSVYSGGQGSTAIVSGNTNSEINNSTITESVYGGGNAGRVIGNTILSVEGTKINDSLYGGGKSANIASSDINISLSQITNNVYGGGEEGQVVSAQNNYSTDIYIKDSEAGNIFGGGKGVDATVAQATSITTEKTIVHKLSEDQGNVFGGGDKGSVQGSTHINVLEDSIINDSIYGGGNEADVSGSTSVAIDTSSVKGNIYGGGNAGAVYGTGAVDKSTAVSVIESEVEKSVFGGGNKGEVIGNTSVLISQYSKVTENVYGGGNEANVNGTTVSVSIESTAQNVYGGGNLGQVTEDTEVIIDNSIIKNNVYGGGSGSALESDGSKGTVGRNVDLEIRNASEIQNQAFGGGQGVTALVKGNVLVDFKENSQIANDIYGGGDNGQVDGSTEVHISSSSVGGSAYAAGNGASAKVLNNSYIVTEGLTQIGKSIFGGGNAAETGAEGDKVLAIVDIAGAVVGENVYGGANSSIINGSTVTNIGAKAIDNYYGVEKGLEIGKIEIAGTVFGGGESMTGEDSFDYESISVTERILINIDGNGYELTDTDPNTIDIYGSIFGSGNASSAKQNGDINIRNFGKQSDPKRAVSIQRANIVLIDNSSLYLNGTTDSTAKHADGYFTFNRIANLKIKNNTNLFLVNGANLLEKYESLVGDDGNEEYASVNIFDTVHGSDGRTYEVKNGYAYDVSGNVQYYVKAGIIYRPTNGAGEDEAIAEVVSVENATTINSNVDNRIYMYSGRNLNISPNEDAIKDYGEVKGMTFFGIFKSSSSDEAEEDTETENSDCYTAESVYTGIYTPGYTTGGQIEWAERNFSRAYVLGMHQKSPEQDIAVDGFYTVYEKLADELDGIEVIDSTNYSGTSYTSYITPTPEEDDYYMWYAGPDEDTFYYSITLIASKHSTLGTKELGLVGISFENATLTLKSFDAALVEGVGLYDKNDIPNINEDQDAANNNFGLSMKTSNSGWSMIGATDFYADAITDDNSNVNSRFSGDSVYTIENLKTTPVFNFYFYSSNNITDERDLGNCQINMALAYWKDSLNRGTATVIIDVILMSEFADDTGYNGAITPGAQYELFTNSVTNVTTKSSFSTYFELAQDNFSQVENVGNFYDRSYRIFTTEYAFPAGTTITMIDRWDKSNPKYYYYDVTEADHNNGKVEYRLSEFIGMGSSNEPYDEINERINYYKNDLDYQYENFIFIVNFENTDFSEEQIDANLAIVKNQKFRMYLKYKDDDGKEQILLGQLDEQIDSISYGIYDTESTIELDAELSKKKIFLGNAVTLDVDIIYNVRKSQSVTIFDTRYFDKKLGIKLTLAKKNTTTGEYEAVSGANLLGLYYELGEERYYPRADGTTRIKIAELVSNASSSIKIGTENCSLGTGEYRILIESFGSADGIYYGIEASDSTYVYLEIVNDLFGLNSTLPENQVIIDKTTGFTLDSNGFTPKENGNKNLDFSVEYLSGLNNPYITVSLYRRNYDEGLSNPYDNTYTKVDLKDYVNPATNETIEVPKEVLTEDYESGDEEFVESLKQFEHEYTALDTSTIQNIVSAIAGSDTTVSVTLNKSYSLKDSLISGTYKVVFKLYDAAESIAYKIETDENGAVSKKPFNVMEYTYVGETFTYIIIK